MRIIGCRVLHNCGRSRYCLVGGLSDAASPRAPPTQPPPMSVKNPRVHPYIRLVIRPLGVSDGRRGRKRRSRRPMRRSTDSPHEPAAILDNPNYTKDLTHVKFCRTPLRLTSSDTGRPCVGAAGWNVTSLSVVRAGDATFDQSAFPIRLAVSRDVRYPDVLVAARQSGSTSELPPGWVTPCGICLSAD